MEPNIQKFFNSEIGKKRQNEVGELKIYEDVAMHCEWTNIVVLNNDAVWMKKLSNVWNQKKKQQFIASQTISAKQLYLN